MNVKGFEFSDIIINYINDNTWQRYKKKISKKSQKFQRRYFKKWKKYFLNYHYYNYSVTDYKYVTAALRLSRKWC